MTININAQLQFDTGSEIGLRLYPVISPDTKEGNDLILSQNGTRDTLYELANASGITNRVEYLVDVFETDGSGTINVSGALPSSSIYIGPDSGTYWLGNEESSNNNPYIYSL